MTNKLAIHAWELFGTLCLMVHSFKVQLEMLVLRSMYSKRTNSRFPSTFVACILIHGILYSRGS